MRDQTPENAGVDECPHGGHLLAECTSRCTPENDQSNVPVERDLWWGYLCPALANIGPLKQAQSDLIALGTDWAEAGRILSRVHLTYVNAAHDASQRYLSEVVVPPGVRDE